MPSIGADSSSAGPTATGIPVVASPQAAGHHHHHHHQLPASPYQQRHYQQQQQQLQQMYQTYFAYSPPLPASPTFASGSPPTQHSVGGAPHALLLGGEGGQAALQQGQNITGHHAPAAYAYYTQAPGSPPVARGEFCAAAMPMAAAHDDALLAPPAAGSAPYAGDAHMTDAVDSRNVYVRNLPEECGDQMLVQMAAPYGEIESSKSIIHEASGKCKGYGFVKYRTAEQAQRAIAAFGAQGFESTLARDSFKSKLKRLQDRSSANVYVSNLSSDVDEAALVELIKPHAVVSARILRDAVTGQHKGAGFARMADRETALLVIEKLKGVRLPNAPGPLLPRIADSEGQKQLKKQVNGDGARFDDVFVRPSTSPVLWSPVLLYSPVAADGFDGARRLSSPTAPLAHSPVDPRAFAGYAGSPVYAVPGPYGYASSGYASPVGYSLGYASSGYVSPVQMPGSPQLAYSPERAAPHHAWAHEEPLTAGSSTEVEVADALPPKPRLPHRRRPQQPQSQRGSRAGGRPRKDGGDLASALGEKLCL
ncbi:hypothetical protein GGI26_006428 [Coemansia sp. RSA 1358]|uniref:RRM domain-containing protein n=1 Tax=Coemansia umbellata TaxID=1424467 RepID=A0ABQ8PCX5_9FUNG|nr:hypothetical protein EDC05_006382 [Coemansia umbellata]KAJ2618670.1 hypothetical protein GGI26_006428 [Coemansia sp. RSA 1358]